MIKSLAFLPLIFLFVALFGYAKPADAGFGISPPWLRNEHLAPGAHYEQNIYLVQGKPETDVKVTISFESAEDIASWITVQPGKEFVIPAGTNQFPVRFLVDVPKDAGYTTYTGKIHFVAGSTGGEGAVTIQLGSLADISLAVTSEKFTDFKVNHVSIDDIEEGWPVKVSIDLDNLGNVKARPTLIKLSLYDSRHEKKFDSGEAQTTDWVEPFKGGIIVAKMPALLGIGDYWADYEVYKGDEIVARDKQRFKVVAEGTIDYWPRYLGISIAWWILGIGIILIIFAIIKFNFFGKLLVKLGIEVKRKKS